MKLDGQTCSNIAYEPGKELWQLLMYKDCKINFIVDKALTSNEKAMKFVANMLDEIDDLEIKAKDFLKSILLDNNSKHYELVLSFAAIIRYIDAETAKQRFSVEDLSSISFSEIIDSLKLRLLGSCIDSATGKLAYIMQLVFSPETKDYSLLIYFDINKEIYDFNYNYADSIFDIEDEERLIDQHSLGELIRLYQNYYDSLSLPDCE